MNLKKKVFVLLTLANLIKQYDLLKNKTYRWDKNWT